MTTPEDIAQLEADFLRLFPPRKPSARVVALIEWSDWRRFGRELVDAVNDGLRKTERRDG